MLPSADFIAGDLGLLLGNADCRAWRRTRNGAARELVNSGGWVQGRAEQSQFGAAPTTMTGMARVSFDEIGYWSEVKLAIVKEYATAYSAILSAQRKPALHHVYIDAFAGAGAHVSKTTQTMVPGSPLNALAVTPPFKEHHLIDYDGSKVESLRSLVGDRTDVSIHEGDCNNLLLTTVFPRVRYEDYRRGLCLLDPYGLTLRWEVMRVAGSMKSIEFFLNFPIMDMNRNALWSDPSGTATEDIERMNAFWGDESWRQAAYAEQGKLFGGFDATRHGGNDRVVQAFRERLKKVAGFKYVPEPMPMRNTRSAIVYYLFFASHSDTGRKIVESIFAKYKTKGVT